MMASVVVPLVPPARCGETVYHRDVPRYTGRHRRGNGGFELHYRREQCKRRATAGGLCWQHAQNAAPLTVGKQGGADERD